LVNGLTSDAGQGGLVDLVVVAGVVVQCANTRSGPHRAGPPASQGAPDPSSVTELASLPRGLSNGSRLSG